MDKLNSIQSLRGIAVLFVALSHVGFISFGAFGVDLFFCISGFIMMFITEKTTNHFFAKRLIRIVPLYWLVTTMVFVLVMIKPGLLNSTTADYTHYFKSLFFIPFDKNGYIEPILGPGWTLNYEMFFYFVFFLSLLVSFRYRGLILSMVFVFLVLFGALFEGSMYWDFYTNPIILEFCFGILAYYLIKKDFSVSFSLGVLCILVLIFVCLFIRIREFEDLRFLLWGLPMFLVFLVAVKINLCFYGSSVLEKIGDASYSIYLTHLFVILGVDRLLFSMKSLSLGSAVVAILSIAVSVIIGFLVYRLVELPIHRYLSVRVFK